MPIELLKKFELADLLDTESIDWKRVEATFQVNPGVFESLLFRLHFKRHKPHSAKQKKNILEFLKIAYSATADVRYFNEFLWFFSDGDGAEDLKKSIQQTFEKNLNGKGHHTFPLATRNDVREFLDEHIHPPASKYNKNLNVGLIGFPIFFGNITRELKKLGFDVQQVFIPFHPNRKIGKLLSFPLLVKLLSVVKRNPYSYQTLNYHYKDPAIGAALVERKFDIGFHKLNFIIKDNVFGHFRKGLINDHWAVLPHIRGKSTIAWTLLFGFPMVCTLHLIDQGVDTGKIIGYYEYDVTGIKKINGVRNKLRSTLTERVVDGIRRLSVDDFAFIENTPNGGLTYYEIHPWLYEFIEKRILI